MVRLPPAPKVDWVTPPRAFDFFVQLRTEPIFESQRHGHANRHFTKMNSKHINTPNNALRK